MGATYENITLRGVEQGDVVLYLNEIGMQAFVSPTENGLTVVYCQPSDTHVVGHLSRHLHCVALLIGVFDGDAFAFQLFEDGALTDQYESWPGTFYSIDESRFEFDEHAIKICTAFGVPSMMDEVNDILLGRLNQLRSQSLEFSSHRQPEALRRALNLPWWAGHVTYDHVIWGRRLQEPDAKKNIWLRFVETAPRKRPNLEHRRS